MVAGLIFVLMGVVILGPLALRKRLSFRRSPLAAPDFRSPADIKAYLRRADSDSNDWISSWLGAVMIAVGVSIVLIALVDR